MKIKHLKIEYLENGFNSHNLILETIKNKQPMLLEQFKNDFYSNENMFLKNQLIFLKEFGEKHKIYNFNYETWYNKKGEIYYFDFEELKNEN